MNRQGWLGIIAVVSVFGLAGPPNVWADEEDSCHAGLTPDQASAVRGEGCTRSAEAQPCGEPSSPCQARRRAPQGVVQTPFGPQPASPTGYVVTPFGLQPAAREGYVLTPFGLQPRSTVAAPCATQRRSKR